MEKQCTYCGNEMKLIPAGISKKTNKPYQAFYACPDRGCGKTERVGGHQAPKACNCEETFSKLRIAFADLTARVAKLESKPVTIEQAQGILGGEIRKAPWEK